MSSTLPSIPKSLVITKVISVIVSYDRTVQSELKFSSILRWHLLHVLDHFVFPRTRDIDSAIVCGLSRTHFPWSTGR